MHEWEVRVWSLVNMRCYGSIQIPFFPIHRFDTIPFPLPLAANYILNLLPQYQHSLPPPSSLSVPKFNITQNRYQSKPSKPSTQKQQYIISIPHKTPDPVPMIDVIKTKIGIINININPVTKTPYITQHIIPRPCFFIASSNSRHHEF